MKILLDATCLGRGKTGNETYIRGLLSGWRSVGNEFEELELVAAVHRKPKDLEGVEFHLLEPGGFWRRNLVQLPEAVQKTGSQLFHASYWCVPWMRSGTVVMVHDVSFVRHPEWFRPGEAMFYRTCIKSAVSRAERVLTVSEFSKREIAEVWNIDAEKIIVTPNGPGFGDVAAVEKTEVSGRPSLLFVGGWHPRKNLLRLIRAFEKLCEEGLNLDLRIAGPKSWLSEGAVRALHESKWKNRMVDLGYLTEEELDREYRRALILVYPSLYEGFGLPILEAFSRQCVVCCSSIEVFREISGEGAVYFRPDDIDDMARTIQDLVKSEALRKEKIAEGQEILKKFSWQETARLTGRVYRQLQK